jgi:hypothetical protein
MTAHLAELLIFSFLLPIGLWGVGQAFRRDRTWIAGALVLVAGELVLAIVTALLPVGGWLALRARSRRPDRHDGNVPK